MDKSPYRNTQSRGPKLNTLVHPYDPAQTLADALRGFSAKIVARVVRTSPRTVEGWKQGRNVPSGEHVIAMLGDDDLCALVLEAAGRDDLAHQAKVFAAREKLARLEGK